jgi:hypothetical protein
MVWQRGACGAPLLLGRPDGSPRFFVGSNGCPPTGQPQGVAPTVCREPSPVGADPCVCPSTNALRGRRRRGNHRGLPLRFGMDHHR